MHDVISDIEDTRLYKTYEVHTFINIISARRSLLSLLLLELIKKDHMPVPVNAFFPVR